MDNHPIPQDVTGFQFKLIGNMTVKQFGYLAAGGVMAVIFYYIPIFIFIKIIFVPFFILTGVAFAFFPIEGRPLDMMVTHFIKALLSPNQYLYSKVGAKLAISTLPHQRTIREIQQQHPTKTQTAKIAPNPLERKEQLSTYLSHLPKHQVTKFDEKEESYMRSLFSLSLPPTPRELQQIQTPVLPIVPEYELTQGPSRVITAEILEDRTAPVSYSSDSPGESASFTPQAETHDADEKLTEKVLEEKTDDLEKELAAAKEKEQQARSREEADVNHKKVLDLSSQLQDAVAAKQKLEEELLQLKKEMAKKDTPQVVDPQELKQPQYKKSQTALESQFVHKIPKNLARAKGIPIIPDSPNVIAGVVKDPRNNQLANILVEIKDKEGSPIRAFKTNQFGQFASATPLANGEYTIELEDLQGKHKFDQIELIANGDVLLPLEILSHDAREALRKELFS